MAIEPSAAPLPRALRGAVFDFGGVMTEPVFRRPRDLDEDLLLLGAFFLRELRDAYMLPTGAHDLHMLEMGRMTEAEFFTRLCERYVDSGGPRVDPLTVRDALVRPGMTACAAMVDAVRQVRQGGYRTALLTNNAREWEPMWRALIPVDDLFDVVVDSSAVGLRKPDPQIYLLTCERLGLAPEECLFVDDLHCNVDAAAMLGMEGVLCSEPETVADEVVRRLLGRPMAGEPV